MIKPDNNDTYGTVSRALHWGMTVLIVWQFLSAGSHLLLDDTAVEAFFLAHAQAAGATVTGSDGVAGHLGAGSSSPAASFGQSSGDHRARDALCTGRGHAVAGVAAPVWIGPFLRTLWHTADAGFRG